MNTDYRSPDVKVIFQPIWKTNFTIWSVKTFRVSFQIPLLKGLPGNQLTIACMNFILYDWTEHEQNFVRNNFEVVGFRNTPPAADTRPAVKNIDFAALLSHFLAVQELHQKSKREARQEAMLQRGVKNLRLT